MIEALTHSELIEKWPSLSDFADDLGVVYGTAKAMRRRSSVPPEYWLLMVQGAQRRGIAGVSYESLALAVAKVPEAAE